MQSSVLSRGRRKGCLFVVVKLYCFLLRGEGLFCARTRVIWRVNFCGYFWWQHSLLSLRNFCLVLFFCGSFLGDGGGDRGGVDGAGVHFL